MRYIIVGPTWPFKGGIVHYNCWLGNKLKREGNEVIGISFKKLYPKILFPGKKQKDALQRNLFEFKTYNLINSINPFSWLKAFRKIKSLNPDVLIFYWWTPFFGFLIRYLSSKIKIKKICICHNVLPHEKSKIDEILTKYGLKKIDDFIVHGEIEKTVLQNIYPNIKSNKITVTPHPTYTLQFKNDEIDKKTAKEMLKLNGKVLLFFGFIRQYKGLEYLIKAMPMINTKIDNLILIIVGEFWDDKRKYQNLITNLELQNIRIIDEYISDEKVSQYFMSSDLLIIPYINATSSGVVQIAFSFNLPVIVTNVGALEEIVSHNKTGFIVPPKDSKAIARTVIDFYQKTNKDQIITNIKMEAYRFSWQRLVEVITAIVNTK